MRPAIPPPMIAILIRSLRDGIDEGAERGVGTPPWEEDGV